MSRVDAAAGMDRLPWLSDEPQPQSAKRRGNAFLGWGVAAIVLVAGAGFWMGANSVSRDAVPPAPRARSSTTVVLPAARPAQTQGVRIPAQPQVSPLPEPDVRQARVPEVRIALPAPRPAEREVPGTLARSPAVQVASPVVARPAVPAPVFAAPKAQVVPLRPWPPRVIAGAAGRLVQIGAFGTPHQAKRGWWFMVRAYPAVAHLPAVVTETRNSNGRGFYRFQVGTTSQAHSEILCQRMQRIDLSCAIVGLPWRSKVER